MTKCAVVDDEPINITIYYKYLRELDYEQCLGATDSTRVLAMILAERPDLIILNVMMPIVSRVDLLRQIRKIGELVQLPVLILTAASNRTTNSLLKKGGRGSCRAVLRRNTARFSLLSKWYSESV